VKSLSSKRRILEQKGREEQRLKSKRGETSLEKLHVSKKKEEQGLKRKRGETSVEKLHVLRREKKKRMRCTSYWERFY
jgi:hypothetical protein